LISVGAGKSTTNIAVTIPATRGQGCGPGTIVSACALGFAMMGSAIRRK
jgi:hypothetical protein